MNRVRSASLCLVLLAAALGGTPMRADEIEELMQNMNQPKIAHKLPDESENGDEWLRKLFPSLRFPVR